jgi:hypothetical protein
VPKTWLARAVRSSSLELDGREAGDRERGMLGKRESMACVVSALVVDRGEGKRNGTCRAWGRCAVDFVGAGS